MKRPKILKLGGNDFWFSADSIGLHLTISFMSGEGGGLKIEDAKKLYEWLGRFLLWAERKGENNETRLQ